MESFTVPMEIANLNRDEFIALDALADDGPGYMQAPVGLLRRLGIEPTAIRQVQHPDGRLVEYPFAQVFIRLAGGEGYVPAIFIPEDVIPSLGHVTLQICGLGVDREKRRLVSVPGRLGPRLRPLDNPIMR